MSPFPGHAFLPKSTWSPCQPAPEAAGGDGQGRAWVGVAFSYLSRHRLVPWGELSHSKAPVSATFPSPAPRTGLAGDTDWAHCQGLQPLMPALSFGKVHCIHFSKSAENLRMSASELSTALLESWSLVLGEVLIEQTEKQRAVSFRKCTETSRQQLNSGRTTIWQCNLAISQPLDLSFLLCKMGMPILAPKNKSENDMRSLVENTSLYIGGVQSVLEEIK